MNVLIIGGTGLISVGIVKHLLERGAKVTAFNRAQRENVLPASVEQLKGDRYEYDAFERQFEKSRYDVVIDMMCFSEKDAECLVRTFAGRCEQILFCSSAMSYGSKMPPQVLADETFKQEPDTEYGVNKALCEALFLRAQEQGKFKATTIRPSNTYGPGRPLIDQLEFNPPSWDRIERGLPVLCAGDGMPLWVSTHRDDVGKLFAYAALNPKTYGQAYNGTHDRIFTWRDYFREGAQALGKTATLIFAPSAWILAHNEKRFGLLKNLGQHHLAYDSRKAKADVPEFRCEIDFVDGARETLTDVKRRSAWVDSQSDTEYQALVDKALAAGFPTATA
ncbi:MAG TPA: NAD-dependent epimerase/dehydratase family protein [Polyangiaceae bacterium]|nr:NAD-dependent epimerase/dehydratase family protein [Polyangiaceae bacterium]